MRTLIIALTVLCTSASAWAEMVITCVEFEYLIKGEWHRAYLNGPDHFSDDYKEKYRANNALFYRHLFEGRSQDDSVTFHSELIWYYGPQDTGMTKFYLHGDFTFKLRIGDIQGVRLISHWQKWPGSSIENSFTIGDMDWLRRGGSSLGQYGGLDICNFRVFDHANSKEAIALFRAYKEADLNRLFDKKSEILRQMTKARIVVVAECSN